MADSIQIKVEEQDISLETLPESDISMDDMSDFILEDIAERSAPASSSGTQPSPGSHSYNLTAPRSSSPRVGRRSPRSSWYFWDMQTTVQLVEMIHEKPDFQRVLLHGLPRGERGDWTIRKRIDDKDLWFEHYHEMMLSRPCTLTTTNLPAQDSQNEPAASSVASSPLTELSTTDEVSPTPDSHQRRRNTSTAFASEDEGNGDGDDGSACNLHSAQASKRSRTSDVATIQTNPDAEPPTADVATSTQTDLIPSATMVDFSTQTDHRATEVETLTLQLAIEQERTRREQMQIQHEREENERQRQQRQEMFRLLERNIQDRQRDHLVLQHMIGMPPSSQTSVEVTSLLNSMNMRNEGKQSGRSEVHQEPEQAQEAVDGATSSRLGSTQSQMALD